MRKSTRLIHKISEDVSLINDIYTKILTFQCNNQTIGSSIFSVTNNSKLDCCLNLMKSIVMLS